MNVARMRQRMGAAARQIDVTDAMQVIGFAGLFVGLAMVALPLALCVCSALLLVAGVVRSW